MKKEEEIPLFLRSVRIKSMKRQLEKKKTLEVFGNRVFSLELFILCKI